MCNELSEDSVANPTVVPDLLDQIEGQIATFLGVGAYDDFPTRQEIAHRYEGVEFIIPPPKTATLSLKATTNPTARYGDILAIQEWSSPHFLQQSKSIYSIIRKSG
ncbi:hypothetical protein [Pseudovibrio sp. POLY-S9]|uniref:hypothetical protein n=1 Tax=Pseudovibrio sp. POLY-S9 TaxID=1576596 RepID=UPI00070A5029|nr:hypothetical protein [Pseudovibrio sp. POLY-S9]